METATTVSRLRTQGEAQRALTAAFIPKIADAAKGLPQRVMLVWQHSFLAEDPRFGSTRLQHMFLIFGYDRAGKFREGSTVGSFVSSEVLIDFLLLPAK